MLTIGANLSRDLAHMALQNGGKFDLKLGSATTSRAEYSALLQTSGASFQSLAIVSGEGTGKVDFGVWVSGGAGEPPEWLLSDVRAALKAALRSCQAQGRFPRRITRWRPEPSG